MKIDKMRLVILVKVSLHLRSLSLVNILRNHFTFIWGHGIASHRHKGALNGKIQNMTFDCILNI